MQTHLIGHNEGEGFYTYVLGDKDKRTDIQACHVRAHKDGDKIYVRIYPQMGIPTNPLIIQAENYLTTDRGNDKIVTAAEIYFNGELVTVALNERIGYSYSTNYNQSSTNYGGYKANSTAVGEDEQKKQRSVERQQKREAELREAAGDYWNRLQVRFDSLSERQTLWCETYLSDPNVKNFQRIIAIAHDVKGWKQTVKLHGKHDYNMCVESILLGTKKFLEFYDREMETWVTQVNDKEVADATN